MELREIVRVCLSILGLGLCGISVINVMKLKKILDTNEGNKLDDILLETIEKFMNKNKLCFILVFIISLILIFF